MYLLAIFLPPVAVFIKKGLIASVINLFLCFLGVIPGIIHALLVVSNSKADDRSKKLEDVMKETAVLNMQTLRATQAANSSVDIVDQVERLAKLKDAGHLTQEEFETKKKQLLS